MFEKIKTKIKRLFKKHTEETDIKNVLEEVKLILINPDYYQKKGLEVFDVIEILKLDFKLGNIVKYLSRCCNKDNIVSDLKKALWYLVKIVERSDNNTITEIDKTKLKYVIKTIQVFWNLPKPIEIILILVLTGEFQKALISLYQIVKRLESVISEFGSDYNRISMELEKIEVDVDSSKIA